MINLYWYNIGILTLLVLSSVLVMRKINWQKEDKKFECSTKNRIKMCYKFLFFKLLKIP